MWGEKAAEAGWEEGGAQRSERGGTGGGAGPSLSLALPPKLAMLGEELVLGKRGAKGGSAGASPWSPATPDPAHQAGGRARAGGGAGGRGRWEEDTETGGEGPPSGPTAVPP